MHDIDLVIPVYNNSKYLKQCIDSAIFQHEVFKSIVLVDDCSTEPGVRDILSKYKNAPNIKIIYEDYNLGICGSQNRGVAQCSAEYVGFLDCDDILTPDACARARQALAGEEGDYFFSNRVHINSGGDIVGYYDASKDIDASGDPINSLIDNMFASHFKVIRRSTLARIGGFELGTEGIQDWDVALKISKFGTFCYLNEYLYLHRIHDNQTTSSKQGALFLKTNKIRRSHLESQNLIRHQNISQSTATKIESVKDKLLFSRKYQARHFAESVHEGVCFGWADGCFSVVPLGAFADGENVRTPEFEVAFIYSHIWHDLGKMRYQPWFGRAIVIYFVDSSSSDSVTMARWFNSYFTRLVPMDEMANLALEGYIE